MTSSGVSLDPAPTLLPGAAAGYARPAAQAVEAWATAAWLLAVEGRAFMEDLEGGVDQPDLRRVTKLRLVELLADVDARLAGRRPAGDQHALALALEYGIHEVAQATGPDLVALFDLAEPLDGEGCAVEPVFAFWQRLLAAFPGEIPDPLVAAGQRQVLRALRSWSKVCAAAGIDAAFLEPFLKDA